MARQHLNDGESGLNFRSKLNSNFSELYSSASIVAINSSSYIAFTNKVNYFTGSQYIDSSHNRIDGVDDYTYGFYNDATYTGSKGGFIGIHNNNIFSPSEQMYNSGDFPYVIGTSNALDHTYTGSVGYIVGEQLIIRNWGYLENEMTAYNISMRSFNHSNEIIMLNMLLRYDGTIGNSYGVLLRGLNPGLESANNIYGIYMDSGFFPTSNVSQSYGVYVDANVPNYFGGYLEGSNGLPILATTSSITPTVTSSVTYEIDESNNKLYFHIVYGDGTVHSASAYIY